MRKTIGYMVTFTTYGTWLQGDERGWVKEGVIYEENATLHNFNESNLKGRVVRLNKKGKEIVREAICRKARARGEEITAISVWSNHLHIVQRYSERPIEETIRIYKNTATAALRSAGFKGKVWTKGFDRRFCFNEGELRARVDYVNKHWKIKGKTIGCISL
jgi:REP element-mobilizing transposase RayT